MGKKAKLTIPRKNIILEMGGGAKISYFGQIFTPVSASNRPPFLPFSFPVLNFTLFSSPQPENLELITTPLGGGDKTLYTPLKPYIFQPGRVPLAGGSVRTLVWTTAAYR